MLASLHIENIAVIKTVDIDFERGFMVLSGETGAGKSIIIDSINFLIGNRTSRELVRNGEDKATVSAVFTDCGDAVIRLLEEYGITCDGSFMISRTLSRDGKNTIRLEGRTVTQSLLKEVCRLLINIHGQNENQRLMQRAAQLDILDAYAGNAECREIYAGAFSDYTDAARKLASMDSDIAANLRMRDMLAFQIDEISSAKLKVGEEETLEEERLRLANLEKIRAQTGLAYRSLYGSEKGVTTLLDRASAALAKIGDVLPSAAAFSEKLTGYRYEIEDIAENIREYADDDEDPTAKLNRIESRLDTITKLKRKYGSDIAGILAYREEATEKLDAIDNSDERKEELSALCEKLKKQAVDAADTLRDRRRKAAEQIVLGVKDTLEFLDMPKVRFSIDVTPAEKLRTDGGDDVEFRIAANAGDPLMPLEKIASGGELSRIMLALKSVLADKDGVETVIFDEVDAGISGKTSRKVGIKLKEIARSTQVICVTHSAQIASIADQHYLISKHEKDGRTESKVDLLDENGRVNEVARILGGIDVTELQKTAAREMIEEGKQYG